MPELTPMRAQYKEIKSKYSDCLLLFRLGDFYELFDEDAKKASKELDLALTTRDRGKAPEEQTPMCGVPFHSAEAYIARLIAKGYKVAVCEQTEDPALAKGLVQRDVIRVITPGTVTESSMLEEGRSNYVAAVYLDAVAGAAAFCDVSTGEFCAASFAEDSVAHIGNELARFAPREALLSQGAAADESVCSFLRRQLNCLLEPDGGRFDYMACAAILCEQFGVTDVDALNLESPAAIKACGALLSYIKDNQKCELTNISGIDIFEGGKYMELDYTARRSLELTENLRTGEKRGSLLWVLDKTKTPMGSRLIRSWVERPLLSPVAIGRRLSAVTELRGNAVLRGELRRVLGGIGDMQRLVTRAVFGTANARDVAALGECCACLPELKTLLAGSSAALLKRAGNLNALEDMRSRISRAICDEPPFSVREGGMLRAGYSEEVDRLRNIRENGAKLVSELEARERERTGIKKLKVGYNKVFGYYIDVPNSAGDTALPPEYIRKQTLVSNERYFTPELKELETELTGARERICELEYRYFCELRDGIADRVDEVKATAAAVAELDALCSLAEVAAKNNYCCPEIDLSGNIAISEGRHPVVELTQKDTLFVPNDTLLGGENDRIAVITGPNMAGKSTYMRQTALIVLMAQMGSFVPARSASIGIVDRVFTRIGASDDLSSGKSTFMVEMTEVASILRSATKNSLIILDEIGRGTSTYDGMAIARAVLEYCAGRRLSAKTMFATHYHELTALEGEVRGVRNYYITARKKGDKLIFLRKIVRGAADESYGIEVAKLAGVPEQVVSRARVVLEGLSNQAPSAAASPAAKSPESDLGQLSIGESAESEAIEKLRAASLDTMSPIEAMNLLYEIKKMLET